jgi:hypothetical protein
MLCFAHILMIDRTVAGDPYAYKGTMYLVQILVVNTLISSRKNRFS